MNTLLLYPEFTDSIWSMRFALKAIGKKSLLPPLSLITVASMLPKDWNFKLVDVNLSNLEDEDIKWADMVFISAMNVQYESVNNLINKVKSFGKMIVAGGPLFIHEYMNFPAVDVFVLNEAEITIKPFLDDLSKGNLKKIYSSNEFADMHSSPIPRWDLVSKRNYTFGIIQYSRGCPFLCDFCDVTTLYGRKPRTKTPEQIITELDLLITDSSFDLILFADDNFISNKKKLKEELLPKMIEWRKKNKFAPGFATQISINIAEDDKLITLMLEAGFRYILIGIESPSKQTLEECSKNQNTNRDLFEDIHYLHQRGFIINGSFILGFDSDTSEVFQDMIDFINKSSIVITTVNLLKAPPGTELYDRMKLENRLLEKFSFEENKTNIVPKMDKEVLEKGFLNVIDNIFPSKHAINRIKEFYKFYKPPNVETPITRKIEKEFVVILLKTFFTLGILWEDRKYFWKLILWTLVNKPKRIDQSLNFLFFLYQYHHLRKKYRKNSL
jgi:radical SAM superfamily enzyme YgiQ (UPF0313 family)